MKDWYEAYADAANDICGKRWPEELNDDENAKCEAYADSVAIRPDCEK